jgi:hypothetical protein
VPSARELLEQADALMRKNRSLAGSDIPVLTDAITATPSQLPHLHGPAGDIPVLTERVEDAVVSEPPPGPTAAVAAMFEGDPSDWLVMDTVDPSMHSITGGAPDTLAVVPPVTLKAAEFAAFEPSVEPEVPARATHKAAGSAPTPPPVMSNALEPVPSAIAFESPPIASEYFPQATIVDYVPPPPEMEFVQPFAASEPVATLRADADAEPATASDERWRAFAEQVSMQVLQRIDLFTDTGLKEQLARHLQPIVDRASAELVGEINDQVGKLVRSYVAEAIEREIAQWRSEHR